MSIIDEASMQRMFHIHQQTQAQQPKIELYVEFKHVVADEIQHDSNMEDNRSKVYKGMNSNSEEDYEATYKASDENKHGDRGGETVMENIVVPPVVSQPMVILAFMHSFDLDTIHAPEFFEYVNIGVADPKDREFMIRM
ncbi:hypothetical protein AHAS_Ahas05G0048500 [Arachis hypogaea]